MPAAVAATSLAAAAVAFTAPSLATAALAQPATAVSVAAATLAKPAAAVSAAVANANASMRGLVRGRGEPVVD